MESTSGWRLAAWLWFLILLYGALRLLAPGSVWLPLVSIWLMVYFAGFLVTVVHEFGHAAFARLAGFRVARIVIGAGPRLVTLRRGTFTLEVAAFPVGGLTASAYRGEKIRARVIGTMLAGPLAHGLFVLAVSRLPTATEPSSLTWIIVRMGIWLLIINLLPLPLHGGTDGRKALDLLRMADQRVAALGRTEELTETATRLQSLLASGTPQPEQAAELKARLAEELSHPGLTGIERAVTVSNLAVACLLSGDPALLPEADRASAAAYAALPSEPAVAATRGEVLAALGQDEDAVDLLQKALHDTPSAAEQYSHAFLALALIRRGDLFGARRHLALADPGGRVVAAFAEASSRVAEAELQNVLRNYYRPGRSTGETADLLRTDAGPELAEAIGRNLASCLSRPERLTALVRAEGEQLSPEEVATWLEGFVEALRTPAR